MVGVIFKTGPLAIMLFGTMQVLTKAPEFLDFSKKTATQIELNEMAKFISLSAIDPLSTMPTEDGFSDYVKSAMRPQNRKATRDVSRDQWGNAYRFKKINEQTFEVRSDGPDKKPGTSDDISARVFL